MVCHISKLLKLDEISPIIFFADYASTTFYKNTKK